MRQEIEDAIALAQNIFDRRSKEPELVTEGSRTFAVLSASQRQRLDTVMQNLLHLEACIATESLVKRAYIGTTTSVVIDWGELATQSITVEISLYGSLAAVFLYGNPPPLIVTTVERCLRNLSLKQLTEDEIVELQEQDKYYLIF